MTRNSAGIGRGEELAALADRCARIAEDYVLPGNPPAHAELVSSLTKTNIAMRIRELADLIARQPQQAKD